MANPAGFTQELEDNFFWRKGGHLMIRRITIVSVAALACLALGTQVMAASATDIATCKAKGIQKNVNKAINGFYKNIIKCEQSVAKGKLPGSTDCLGDAIKEKDGTVTTTYNGKVFKEVDKLLKKITKACSGADKTANTADDVGLDDLEGDLTNGLQVRPWGAALGLTERATVKYEQKTKGGVIVGPYLAQMQNTMTEDCMTLEEPSVWAALPRIVRLADTFLCLAQSEAIAQVLKEDWFSASAKGNGRISVASFDFVAPPGEWDAGADLTPAPSGDGVNDALNIPISSGCPLPGIGACAADPNITCNIAPGSGADPFSGDCPPSGGACGPPGDTCCVEALTGPDGITVADIPTSPTRVQDGKLLVEVGDFDEDGLNDAELKCYVQLSDPNVTTDPSGTCSGGPSNGSACANAGDCDTQSPSRYSCQNGDEYHCQVNGYVGSNADNVPPCASPCLAALIGGPPKAGCGVGGGALCVVATCLGGDRDGQLCDITGVTGCPSGFCNGVGGPLALTGDETGFFAPAFGGEAYLTCPFEFVLSQTVEMANGAGWSVSEITDEPISACLPANTSVFATGGYIHEPGPTTDTALLGIHTSGATASGDKKACPGISFPLPGGNTGLPTSVGVGQIIGVTGVSTH